MSKGLTRYGAVATKLRGMRAGLLKTEDYKRLAGLESVKAIADALYKMPAYKDVIENKDSESFRREYFELVLRNSLYEDVRHISFFLSQKQRKFMQVYFVSAQLRFINNVIRLIFGDSTEPYDFSGYRILYARDGSISFDDVINAKSMDELLAALKGSRYFETLSKVKELLKEPTLADYENALMRYRFALIVNEIKRFELDYDKEVLQKIYGAEMDFLNMIWIGRCKQYYDIKPAEIHALIIPPLSASGRRLVSRLIEAQDMQTFMNIVKETKYGKRLEGTDFKSIGTLYEKELHNIRKQGRISYPYSFAAIEAYLYDKDLEINRIIRIAESVRYGYAPDLILKALNIA